MKKRNPQDATLRNVRATRTSLASLHADVQALTARVKFLDTVLRAVLTTGVEDTQIPTVTVPKRRQR